MPPSLIKVYYLLINFQLDTLKYTVDRTAKDLDIARQKYTLLKKEVTNRIEKYVPVWFALLERYIFFKYSFFFLTVML